MREQLASINFWYKLILPFLALVSCTMLFDMEVKLLWFTGWILNLVFVLVMLMSKDNFIKSASWFRLLMAFSGPLILGISNFTFSKGWGNYFIENTFLEMCSMNLVILGMSFKHNKGFSEALPGMLMLIFFNSFFLAGLALSWLEINPHIGTWHLISLLVSFAQICYSNVGWINRVKDTGKAKDGILFIVVLVFGWLATPPLVMLVKYLFGL